MCNVCKSEECRHDARQYTVCHSNNTGTKQLCFTACCSSTIRLHAGTERRDICAAMSIFSASLAVSHTPKARKKTICEAYCAFIGRSHTHSLRTGIHYITIYQTGQCLWVVSSGTLYFRCCREWNTRITLRCHKRTCVMITPWHGANSHFFDASTSQLANSIE